MGRPIVDVHEIHDLIVGYIYIHITVIIHIACHHTKPFTAVFGNTGFVRPVRECSIPIIVVKIVRNSFKNIGITIGPQTTDVFTAPGIFIHRKFHVIGHIQV